jgi:hypothetical protein
MGHGVAWLGGWHRHREKTDGSSHVVVSNKCDLGKNVLIFITKMFLLFIKSI